MIERKISAWPPEPDICAARSVYQLACHLKCARDRSLVVIITAHGDRKVEPGEHLNIAAVDELGADSPPCWKMPNFAELRRSDLGSGESLSGNGCRSGWVSNSSLK